MTEYRPIDCATYERCERAVLHHERLRVHWLDDAGIDHLESLVPEDLLTEGGEEFLVGRNASGIQRRLRLDQIRGLDPLDHPNSLS